MFLIFFSSPFHSLSPMEAVKGRFTTHFCPRLCCPHRHPHPWRDLCHCPCQTPNLPPPRRREGVPRPLRQVSYSQKGAGSVMYIVFLISPLIHLFHDIRRIFHYYGSQQQWLLHRCKTEQIYTVVATLHICVIFFTCSITLTKALTLTK